MAEWVVTSSLLILVVAVLRYALRGKLSLRLQYSLWLIVLLRLLVPVSLGASSISVMNTVNTFTSSTVVSERPNTTEVSNSPSGKAEAPAVGSSAVAPVEVTETVEPLSPSVLLYAAWLTGAAAVALCFTVSNIRFYKKLRSTRVRIPSQSCPLPVYLTDAAETPCIFGLIHPSVYVTNEAAGNAVMLSHVAEHEATHFYHGDHVWSVLRGLCLALHWYNPLVWWAASLSMRDSELACDEATIMRIGESQRTEYGRTLISLTCVRRGAAALLCSATTMTGSSRSIRERICLIAKKPKMKLYALIIALLIAACAVGCTFTGAGKESVMGQPVFTQDVGITGITVEGPTGQIFAGEQEINELAVWVRGFKYGELCEDTPEPGANSYSIKLSFADGSVQRSGIDYAEYEGERRFIERDEFPTAWKVMLLNEEAKKISEEMAAAVQTAEPSPSPSPEPAIDIGTPLTDAEIEEVTAAFTAIYTYENNMAIVNPRCCLVTSYYESPEQINFYRLVKYFTPNTILGESDEDEFLLFYEASEGNGVSRMESPSVTRYGVPVHRIYASDIDDFLKMYTGVGLADLDSLDGVTYLDKYDAFYCTTSDMGLASFTCKSGYTLGNTVVLYGASDVYRQDSVLTLTRLESGEYHIVSYLPA